MEAALHRAQHSWKKQNSFLFQGYSAVQELCGAATHGATQDTRAMRMV